jgi:hypothetical protein
MFTVAVTPLVWLAFLPTGLRRRGPCRNGRTTTAVCREHLNPGTGDGPMRVRGVFRPDPELGEYSVIVHTHEHIPQVGEKFRIIYDSKNPNHAENRDITDSWSYGNIDALISLTWLAGNLLIVGFAAVMAG